MNESLKSFYKNKTVLVTGHTGFKGGWLAVWLKLLGSNVIGYALPPENDQLNLYKAVALAEKMTSIIADIRDVTQLKTAFEKHQPQIVFHLAAQALVRRAYREPVLTYNTNIMGTVNVLEAIRKSTSVRVAVIVTSDKCYENREWPWGYREIDPMGGYDPYSSSKGGAELVTAAYRKSYFGMDSDKFVASARAGNVIGGGDWAEDRIVPDIYRAVAAGEPVVIRNPRAVRPWQHVLEPLRGYLKIGQNLWSGDERYAEGWNFGPRDEDSIPVIELAERVIQRWGKGKIVIHRAEDQPHEANFLKLDCSKARNKLGWMPILNIDDTIEKTVDWYKEFLNNPQGAADLTTRQINEYSERIVG